MTTEPLILWFIECVARSVVERMKANAKCPKDPQKYFQQALVKKHGRGIFIAEGADTLSSQLNANTVHVVLQ